MIAGGNWWRANEIVIHHLTVKRRRAIVRVTGPLREILRLRKQDKDERDEQESLLDLYLRAMESAGSSQAKAA